MIKIDSNITIPKITKLFHELESSKLDHIDLQLPKKIKTLDFGVLFSLLQLIATWIRYKNSGNLILPVDTIDEAKSYLDENEFVYPAVVLSWEKKILNTKGENIRGELKEPSKKYFEKMEFFELKGNSVPIFCFDHDKSRRGLSKHFYNDNELVSEGTLGFNLYRAFQKIGSFNKDVFRDNLKDSFDDFNAIIHELFSNTHKHAKTNEIGHNLYPNIRAVQLKFHKKTLGKFIEAFSEFPGLIEYFNTKFKTNQAGELYLMEISILDSGPGFIKRYKGVSEYNLSIQDEIEVIKECLYRHNTSSISSKEQNEGIGLDRVLQTIDGKGFVRIKSGRADVFRNMKLHRYDHHQKASDIILYDWKNNSTLNFQVNSPVQGALISIFYPLEFNAL